jgi:hypothetical protein
VDLAGVTYALYQVPETATYGFVIDENGTIVVGNNMSYYYDMPGRPYMFDHNAEKALKDAKDPAGLDGVPEAVRPARKELKLGRFEAAAALAKRLVRSKDEEVKAAAERIVKASEDAESRRLELMARLAEGGKAGELEEEARAFDLAFPRSRSKSKVRSLLSKARGGGEGRKAATAAANFKRVKAMLGQNSARTNAQALVLCRQIASKFQGTHHGDLAEKLVSNWPGSR